MSVDRTPNHELRIDRREAMRRGLCGAAGVMAADHLAADAFAVAKKPNKAAVKAKAKSVIQIFLWGGMSHNDAWDPKPGTGYDYLGEFSRAIGTNVNRHHWPGVAMVQRNQQRTNVG